MEEKESCCIDGITPEMKILPLLNFAKHVLIVGDVVLEKYVFGDFNGVTQGKSLPIFKQDREEYRLGGAGNLTINLQAIGVSVDLVTVVGQNDNVVLDLFRKNNIDTRNFVISKNYQVKVVTQFISGHRFCFRVDSESEGDNEQDVHLAINKNIESILASRQYDAIVLTPCREEILFKDIISHAHRQGIPTIVNIIERNDFVRFAGATYLTTYENSVVDYFKEKRDISTACKEMCSQLHVETCMVFMSDDNVVLYKRKEQFLHTTPISKRKIADVSGATETFLAAMTFGIINHWPLERANQFANLCVDNVAQALGTVPVSIIDIIPQKILTTPEELSILKRLIPKGKSIVLTTGCFDMLHVGHIESLRQAKELGDFLFIALNSDISVKSYKGEKRPIIPLEQRSKMLLATKYVDFLVVFDERRPEWIVHTLDPDVFVKGDEYSEDKIRETFPNLRRIYFTPQITSTTKTIEKIKNV